MKQKNRHSKPIWQTLILASCCFGFQGESFAQSQQQATDGNQPSPLVSPHTKLSLYTPTTRIKNMTPQEMKNVTREEWLSMASKDKIAFASVFFNRLDMQHMDWVDDYYTPEAVLLDPIGAHRGRETIKAYYRSMYEPVTDIRFEIKRAVMDGDRVILPWLMVFKSSKLKGGDWIEVEGISLMDFDPKSHRVTHHQDIFDMGSMVYEHVTVIGALVRWIKNRF